VKREETGGRVLWASRQSSLNVISYYNCEVTAKVMIRQFRESLSTPPFKYDDEDRYLQYSKITDNIM
jgi:hypothetical protein